MKIELIQYNAFFNMRKVIFISILFGLTSVLISIMFLHIQLDFVKWGLLFLLAFWLFLNLFIPQYKTIGTITITQDGVVSIQMNNNESLEKHFTSLSFYYGGYNGEMHEIEIFYTGSRSRDGTRNYFVIDGVEYQVYLRNQEDLQLITSLFRDLINKGIEVKIIHSTKKRKIRQQIK